MAVFGLVFSKLAMLVISPDPLPFCKDTPANIKGGRFLLSFVFAAVFYGLRHCVEMLKLNHQHLLKGQTPGTDAPPPFALCFQST